MSVEEVQAAKIEEVDSDDDMPELEEAPVQPEGTGSIDDDKPNQSRAEKKARKALSKMGLTQVDGITRITLKKKQGILLSFDNPDVFKSGTAETYVFFGEPKSEDMAARARNQREQAKREYQAQVDAQKAKEAAAAAAGVTLEQPSDSADVDESGLSSDDIELVMKQSGAERAAAVKALRNTDGDVVNAIMELNE